MTEAGADLTVASGKGYSAMLAEPDKSRSPDEVFDTVHSWLEELPATRELAVPPEPAGEAPTELQFAAFTERPFTASAAPGRLVGISALPEGETQPLTAVFLNAGAVRRIGPHRLWVDTARRWALRGIPSLRLDLGGIGDSDGDSASLANVAEFYEALTRTRCEPPSTSSSRSGSAGGSSSLGCARAAPGRSRRHWRIGASPRPS